MKSEQVGQFLFRGSHPLSIGKLKRRMPKNQCDNILLNEGFEFSPWIFDLNEPSLASVYKDILIPYDIIKEKNSGNFLKVAHVLLFGL